MRESNSPMILWEHVIESRTLINNEVPFPLFQSQGKIPHECVFGTQIYISSICNFGSHEQVHYRYHVSFPENKEKLGKILGPCKNEVNDMSQSIVTSKGHVITRRTVPLLRTSELHSETEKRKRRIFDDIMQKNFGNQISKPMIPRAPEHASYPDCIDPHSDQLLDDNDHVMPDRTVF